MFYVILQLLDTYTDKNMLITSEAFHDGEMIPDRFTCQGDNYHPTLYFEDVPANAASLLLIIDDPDSADKPWLHWAIWNISPSTTTLKEAEVPNDTNQATNDFGKLGYGGPCPQRGLHHYRFKLFALDIKLDLPNGTYLQDLDNAIVNHIIDSSILTGLYQINP